MQVISASVPFAGGYLGSRLLRDCLVNESWPSRKLQFDCQKMPKTWFFFKKLPKNCPFQFWKKWQFLAIFFKNVKFLAFFDSQIAIFRRVRYRFSLNWINLWIFKCIWAFHAKLYWWTSLKNSKTFLKQINLMAILMFPECIAHLNRRVRNKDIYFTEREPAGSQWPLHRFDWFCALWPQVY